MLVLDRRRSTRAAGLAILVSAVFAGCGGQASTRSSSAATAHPTVVLTQKNDATAARALKQLQAAGKICHEHEGDRKYLGPILSKRLGAALGAGELAQLVATNGSNAVVSIAGREGTLGEYVARAEFALEGCATMEAIVNRLRQSA